MTRHLRITLCLLAAAAIGFGIAGLGAQQLQAQAAAKAEKTAVAVVNVNDLIAKSKKNLEFQAEIQKRTAQLQKEGDVKQKKIGVMRADLDVIADSEQRSKKQREIIEAITELQAWNQIQQQFLQRDRQTFLIDIYADIDKTVAAVAKRDGYDVVVMDVATPDFERLNGEQLLQFMGGRQVIYRADRVDLTQEVLVQMDLDHTRGG